MIKKRLDKKKIVTKINSNKKYFRLSFWRNNISFVAAIALFFLIHAGLITYVLIVRASANAATKVARVPGMLLNFDCTLILFLVLKRLSTYFRNTSIGRKFAVVDEFLSFHKILGFIILVLGLLHSFGHFFNFWYLSRDFKPKLLIPGKDGDDDDDFIPNPAPTYAELLFTDKSGIGWVNASASPTGWAILFIMFIMFPFALPCVRRKGYFQLFYYTHWLYVAFYVILIIHAENFWKWFVGIFVLAFFERILKFIRVNSKKYGDFYIKDVNLLPSRVTNLVIACPKEFKFQAGDYVFINFSRVAKNEWHPFTISSAPEMKGQLTVHIRSLGNWTNKSNF